MLILVFILMILMAVIGWYFAKDFFAPYVIAPSVWIIIIILYKLLPSDIYPITNQFPGALAVWSMGFFISSCMIEYITPAASYKSVNLQPNKILLRAYMIITITIVPMICVYILWKAFITEPETMFRYLRIMSTKTDDAIQPPDFGPLIYCCSVGYVSLFFAFIYFKNKWLIISVILANTMYAFVNMAKTNFLCIIFSSLYLGYSRGIVKKKHLILGLLFFVILSFIVQSVRAVGEDLSMVEMLSLYLTSSMVAFDYYVDPGSALSFGENSLRFIYAVGYSLGISEAPIQTILDFVGVPFSTNTYTLMYPFYKDFGLLGIAFFSIIYGCIYGCLYKKTRTGSKQGLIVYSIFLTFLLAEFIGEMIFTNLSQTLQYVILTALPFVFSKEDSKCVK